MALFTNRKTVAGVMAAFTTAIKDLTTVEENNDSIVANLQVQQEAIAADMAAARAESDHARTVRSKLEALMEVEA